MTDLIEYDGLLGGELVAFDMYFASLCSMQVHPGAGTKGQKALTLAECKNMAIEMLKLRRAVAMTSEFGG